MFDLKKISNRKYRPLLIELSSNAT